MGSYPGSRAAEQVPVENVLRRDDQWGEGDTIRGSGPELESTEHFKHFDCQNSDHFDTGGNRKYLKMSVLTFDSKDASCSYQTVKMFGRRHDFEKVLTGEQSDVDVMADGVNIWDVEARFEFKSSREHESLVFFFLPV